jgi:hypothetical protein
MHQYKYYVFGHYPSSCISLKCRPVSLSKPNVSETGFCLHLQVKPTQLGPIDRASPYLRRRWIMSKNVIFVLMYHHHKPLDHTNMHKLYGKEQHINQEYVRWQEVVVCGC